MLLAMASSLVGGEIPPLELENKVEPFAPVHPRDEQKRDKIEAAALFTHGRVLLQRQSYESALRRFQRAWRYDPQATGVLSEIVDLSFRMKRSRESARFAALAKDNLKIDNVMLRRLAIFLSEEGEWEAALPLYEASIADPETATNDVSYVLTRLEMGRLNTLAGNYAKGVKSFEVVIDALDNPEKYGLAGELKKLVADNAESAYSLMGECFFELKKFEQAEAMFVKANEANKQPAVLAFHRARIAAADQQRAKAIEKLKTYFKAKSQEAGADAYELLFEVHQQQLGDTAKARAKTLEVLQTARADDPENPELAYYCAELLNESGKQTEAADLYEALLETDPTLPGYRELITIYVEQKETEKLVHLLGSAVERVGDLDPFESELDKLAKEDVAKTVDIAAKLITEKEPPAGVAIAGGLLAIRAEQFDRVDTFFRAALKDEENTPPLYLTFGLELVMADRYEESIALFQEAIDKKVLPDNSSPFYYYLAGSLAMAEKYPEALKAAETAVKEDPDSVHYLSRIGWIHYRAGDDKKAYASYEKLLEVFDFNHDSEDVRDVMRETRLILSNIALQQKDVPAAIEWIEQVLDEYPEDIGALNDLGYLWADQNMHLHRAHAMIQKAVLAEPDNAAYRDSLGWVLYRLGKVKEAIPLLESSAKEIPDGEILSHLAEVYAAAKMKKEAAETYQRAGDAYREEGDEEMAREMEKRINR